MTNLLHRYKSGEFENVWNELRSHGKLQGDLAQEANEVAAETMKRVSFNADLLTERLIALGWKPLFGEMLVKPKPDDAEVLAEIERATGASLPLSLREFWNQVGGINLIWDYETAEEPPSLAGGLPLDYLDPLYIDYPANVSYQIEEWEECEERPFLSLSPDVHHKVNVSGGAAYGISLPCEGVDPIFENEEHNLPFVDYLRLCFRWGGFPKLEDKADGTKVQEFVTNISKGFEPF